MSVIQIKYKASRYINTEKYSQHVEESEELVIEAEAGFLETFQVEQKKLDQGQQKHPWDDPDYVPTC
jgi:hypothetical protein